MNTSRKDVRVTHAFSASAERVFDAWLDVDIARQFLFATDAGTMVRAELDPQTGGHFTFVDRRNDGDVLHTGTYLVINRPTQIVFTFSVPQYSAEMTEVTIDILRVGTGCELTLTQKERSPNTRSGPFTDGRPSSRKPIQFYLPALGEPDESVMNIGVSARNMLRATIFEPFLFGWMPSP